MAQLEYFDGTNWIQPGGQTNIALTGAVTGSGTGTINTLLNNYQTMVGSTLSFNWSNNGQFQEYSNYHTLQDSNPPPHFVHLVQSGSGSTYRRWLTVYKPGFGSQPTGTYEINFYHAVNGFQYPFKIDTYGSTLRTYFGTIVDMQNNSIINLPTPIISSNPATKGYVDDLFTNYTSTSPSIFTNEIWMSEKGLWLRSSTDRNHGIIWNSNIDGIQFRGYAGFRWCTGVNGANEAMRLTGDRLSLNIGLTITGKFPLGLNYGYLNPGGIVGTATYQINNYSIDCTDRIKASEFNAYSSIKKKIILAKSKDIEEEAEKVFSRIPLFKYEYKDKIKEGSGINYGVIAESLNEVLPDYVDMKSYDFVPNIMKKCKIKKSNSDYIINIKSLNIEVANEAKQLKIITKDKSIDVDILELTENYIKISTHETLEKEEFIYGTYEACPAVSKQKLFELSMVVIQNLIKRIEKLESEIIK